LRCRTGARCQGAARPARLSGHPVEGRKDSAPGGASAPLGTLRCVPPHPAPGTGRLRRQGGTLGSKDESGARAVHGDPRLASGRPPGSKARGQRLAVRRRHRPEAPVPQPLLDEEAATRTPLDGQPILERPPIRDGGGTAAEGTRPGGGGYQCVTPSWSLPLCRPGLVGCVYFPHGKCVKYVPRGVI
jgi:hypothetical protein